MPANRIFLSYARSDLEHALSLRALIEAEVGAGSVWHDVRDLAGDHWWTEIEDTIRSTSSVEHLVLLASAQALAPERYVVRDEWRLAQQEGKAVTNVFWSARPNFVPPSFGSLPNWIRAKSLLDLSLPNRMQALIQTLKQPGRGPRRPFMAPPLPEGFVQRPGEFDKLKKELLDAKGDAVSITAALRGAGGFGKTVLAAALAHDDDIRDAFHDGILWVTLGERPKLAELISDLITAIGPESAALAAVSTAANRLKEVLDKRRCLLVIDDAWQRQHLLPFLDGAPSTTRLITTRRDDILPEKTRKVPVDAMLGNEALELLMYGLDEVGPADKAALARLAAERLGEWPILLNLVNGFLRARVASGEVVAQAIAGVIERLGRRGLNAFNRALEDDRTAAIDSTVSASLNLLAKFDQRGGLPSGHHARRFHELAVFPEDVSIPMATIGRLWQLTGGLDAITTEELLERFHGLALLQAFDLRTRTVRLHDVLRTYLLENAEGDAVPILHRHFIGAYANVSGPEIQDPEEGRYFFEHYPEHLAAAGEHLVLGALLKDPQWLQRKLDALSDPLSIISDFNLDPRVQSSLHAKLQKAFALSAGVLTRHPQQMMAQLRGRLPEAAFQQFVGTPGRSAQDSQCGPVISSLISTDDPVTAALQGHSQQITAVVVDKDHSSIFAASHDETIRRWDRHTLRNVSLFGPHNDTVLSMAVSDDLAMVFAGCGSKLFSFGCAVTAWDAGSGRQLWTKNIHEEPVSSIRLLPNSDIAISAGWDQFIRTWRLADGEVLHDRHAHNEGINMLELNRAGSLAITGASDGKMRAWALPSLEQVFEVQVCPVRKQKIASVIEQDRWDYVLCAAFNASEELIATGDSGGQILVWKATDGGKHLPYELAKSGAINSLLFLRDDTLLVAGTGGRELLIYETDTGRLLCRHPCGGVVASIKPLDADLLACGVGNDVLLLSVDVILSGIPTNGARALIELEGVRSLRLSPDGNKYFSLSRQDRLREREIGPSHDADEIERDVLGFCLDGAMGYLLFSGGVLAMDLQTRQASSVIKGDVGWQETIPFDLVYFERVFDGLLLSVVRAGEYLMCTAWSLRNEKSRSLAYITWYSEGHAGFQAMAGLPFELTSAVTSHYGAYALCGSLHDGTVAVYFSLIQSIHVFDAKMDRSISVNYENFFGKGDPARKGIGRLGKRSDDLRDLRSEYGLQRPGTIGLALAAAAGSRYLVIADASGSLEIIDLDKFESRVHTLEQSVRQLVCGRDKTRICVLCGTFVVQLELPTLKPIVRFDVDEVSRILEISDDGSSCICKTTDGGIRVITRGVIAYECYFDHSVACIDVDWTQRLFMAADAGGRMHAHRWPQ
jgi:WD40 repeat protein